MLDMGVHLTDLIRYQLGDVAEVDADARLVEKVRKKPDSPGLNNAFYQRRHQAMADEVPADSEDNSVAIMRMASGATVSWLHGFGGHGSCGAQLILGDQGCIDGFGSRGDSTRLLRTGEEAVEYEALLEANKDMPLEPLAEYFFPERNTRGDKTVDAKLIALELFELAEGILSGRSIEVDGEEGMKDVAALYAVLESAQAGRSVAISEVESCEIYAYQAEIDEALGIR